MKKIPLETTLVGAYRFLFTNIVSIIGTLWFPYVVLFGLMAGLVWLAVPHDWLAGHFPKPEDKEAWLKILPLFYGIPAIGVAALITVAMVLAGLMRHALGQAKGMTFIYFSLGAPVWRMLGAFLLGYIVMIALIIVMVIVFALVDGLGASHMSKTAVVLVNVVMGIFALCFYFYAVVRLFFFLPAVVVAEGRIGLGRSWELGGGNFWRIFFVFLLVTIPVGFVAGIVMQMTILPAVLTQALSMPPHPQPDQIIAFVRSLLPLFPVMLAIMLVERIAMMGLLTGAIGKAYNAVTDGASAEEKASA